MNCLQLSRSHAHRCRHQLERRKTGGTATQFFETVCFKKTEMSVFLNDLFLHHATFDSLRITNKWSPTRPHHNNTDRGMHPSTSAHDLIGHWQSIVAVWPQLLCHMWCVGCDVQAVRDRTFVVHLRSSRICSLLWVTFGEQANLSFSQSELEAVFTSLIDDAWRLTAAETLDWPKPTGKRVHCACRHLQLAASWKTCPRWVQKCDRTRHSAPSWRVARFRNNLHERL